MSKKCKYSTDEIKNWEPMREPIYNYIYYNEELEKKIIDTEYVQRLRRIYQLPSARFVYPGASHSRFLHSLGTMHLAGEFTEKLLDKEDRINPNEKRRLKQAARIAGLLHDVGHGPFSHTFDEAVISESKTLQTKGIRSHEDISRLIMEKSEIKEILSEWGLDKLVRDLFLGEEELEYPLRSISRVFRGWLFTADVLDFLPRDAYFCGIKEWGVDVERIINWTRIFKDGVASEERVLPSITGYLLNRFQMFECVYFHRTARAIDCLMKDVFRRVSSPLGLIRRVKKCAVGDFADFLKLDEHSIFNMILECKRRTADIQEAQRLTKSILTHNIPIRQLDEFAPPFGSHPYVNILGEFEKKYTVQSKLLDVVRQRFLSELRSAGIPTDNVHVYPDFTNVKYLSAHPLAWTRELPIYDRRTEKISFRSILTEFLDVHAFSPKKIRIYADKPFEEQYGKRVKKENILLKAVTALAETSGVVF